VKYAVWRHHLPLYRVLLHQTAFPGRLDTRGWGRGRGRKGQASEKWGIWGILFPHKAKSHGQFGLVKETNRQTDRQTESHTDNYTDIKLDKDRYTDRQRQTDIQTVSQIDRRRKTVNHQTALLLSEIKRK